MGGTKIDIDVNMLSLDVRNPDVISYGDLLYRNNAVTNLSFFNENLSFRGTVNDKGVYSSVVISSNTAAAAVNITDRVGHVNTLWQF